MGCTRHLLNVEWEHHTWRPQVTFAETLGTRETNMWGRVVSGHSVRCEKHQVCDACGKTRHHVSCICDTTTGEHCAIRLEWLERHVTE